MPFSFDNQYQCFIDHDGNYIQHIRIQGINLYGFKTEDQDVFMSAFKMIFNESVGDGQIYSFEIPADVDAYVDDYEYMKNQLNIKNNSDYMKSQILSRNQRRLLETSVTRELVDRIFIIILKDTSYQKLQQRVDDVLRLMSPYNRTEKLSPLEMVKIVYDYYNPYNSMLGDFNVSNSFTSEGDTIPYDIMEYIAPDRLDTPNTLSLDINYVNDNDVMCKVLYVDKYIGNSEPMFPFLSSLSTIPDVEFSLHWFLTDTTKIRKVLDASYKNAAKNQENAKDVDKSIEADKDKQEALKMLNSIVTEGDKGISFSVTIRVKADSKKTLQAYVKEIIDEGKKWNLSLRDGAFAPMEIFTFTAPIGYNKNMDYTFKLCNSPVIAWGYPFIFETLYDRVPLKGNVKGEMRYMPPIYLGNTVQTNGVVFYDNFTLKKDRSSYSEFIVGKTGRGKTTLLMWMIICRFALGYKQFIIDVEGKELNKLTRYLGGSNINCADGNQGRINPLQVRINIPDDDSGEGKISLERIKPLADHIRFLRTFLDSYKGEHAGEFGIIEDSHIEKALEEVYKNHGITYETTAKELVDGYHNDDYPIMLELYNQLIAMKENALKNSLILEQEVNEIRRCIELIRAMAVGADSSMFNGYTNVDLNADIINFDISIINNNMKNRVLKTQYFNILSYIWTNIISSAGDRRIQIYADEFSVIMDPNYTEIMSYFETITKRIRKRYGGLTTATQMISDVLKDEVASYGNAIIQQAEYRFFFGLDPQEVDYLKSNSLIPDSESEFLTRADRGQCYMKVGGQTAMRVQITPERETMKLFRELKD